MSSIPDPTENASMHASPPATDHDVEINELENEDNPDAELSDVSGGGDLRVRNFFVFLFLPVHGDLFFSKLNETFA